MGEEGKRTSLKVAAEQVHRLNEVRQARRRLTMVSEIGSVRDHYSGWTALSANQGRILQGLWLPRWSDRTSIWGRSISTSTLRTTLVLY